MFLKDNMARKAGGGARKRWIKTASAKAGKTLS
jgi:hypothetical protein